MAKEALIKVKEAEETAAEIVRDAAEKAKLIADAAAASAQAQKAAIIDDALRQKQMILEAAENEANARCAPEIAAAEAEIEKILAPGPDKFERAVNIVAERILQP
jgi:V/A-type H+-transporting ATPase subunit G/H